MRLIGRETAQYVANIFKHCISFKLAEERLEAKKEGQPKAPAETWR